MSTASSAAPLILDPEERAARAFLETWTEAQNSGNFLAYSALYADSFVGVKRVGEASFRFNRPGWLADRRPMLAGGARVSVSELSATKSGARWLLSFEQGFSSPSYRDTGRKLLVLTSSGDGLRIVREEMGSVRVDGGGGSARALPGFFAVASRGVVLRSRVEDSWLVPERLRSSQLVRSPPRDDDDGGESAELPEEGPLGASEVVLPPEVRAMKGKRVFVTVSPERAGEPLPPVCESRIIDIQLASSATPAFESVRSARRLDHVYGTYVLGELDPPCPRGLWAAEAPPEPQYLPQSLAGVALVEARRAFRASSEYRALQASFTAKGGLGAWHEREPAAVSFGPRDGKHWVHVSAYRYGNGEIDGNSLSLLFEHNLGAPHLRPLGVVDRDGYMLTPRLAFDFDADQQLELLTAPSGEDSVVEVVQLLRRGKQLSLQKTPVFFTPDFICPG